MSVTKIGEVDLERVKSELFKHDVLRKLQKHSSGQESYLKYSLQGKGQHTVKHDLLPHDPDYNEDLYRKEMPYVYLLIEEFNLYRTRVLTLHPGTNYSYHQDLIKRIHIPITSNEKCMFIVDDVVWRLPADGSVYLIDTTLMHTAINANIAGFNRMHLCGSVEFDERDEEA